MGGMFAEIAQYAIGVVGTIGTGFAGYLNYRTKQLVVEQKREETATTALLEALKHEREALEGERQRAEQLRKERNAADDETHDCEKELRVVRSRLDAAEREAKDDKRRIVNLEKHTVTCNQTLTALRQEFEDFKKRGASGSAQRPKGAKP